MTLEKLLLEYDARRSKSEVIAQRRKDEILSQDPLLAELLAQKNEICLEQLRETMLHPAKRAEIAAQAQQKLAKLDCRIAELGAAETLASIVPQYECPICKDTGYDDRGPQRKLCGCLLKRIYTEIYGAADLSELPGCFEEYDESVFKDSDQRRWSKAAKHYAEKYVENENRKNLLLLRGPSGLGKSYLMSCIAKKLALLKKNVLFIGSFELFGVFHKSRLGEDIPLDPIFDTDVLMIDDLGTEPMTTNVTQEYLFRLLEHRIRKNLPTVISTNMTKSQLKERYTEKVTSRLFAYKTADVLQTIGDDIRLR
ncbi:MAG: ATP-binding protein [Christensenellaceae bacterium]|nr:ATP-binding protein [Christensenellaceae bacterium]